MKETIYTVIFYKSFILVFFLTYSITNAQNIACDGALYLVAYNNDGSVLQRIQPQSNNLPPTIEFIKLSDPKRRVTCLGYNVSDGYLYGLDFNSKELLRIDGQGLITNLGIPPNLNLANEYWAGTVDALGRNLTVIGRNPVTGADHQIYNININSGLTPFRAGLSPLLSDGPVNLSDLAVDPLLGVMYGFDTKNKRVISLGANTVSSYAFPAINANLTSLFFDKSGQLYGYGSSTGGETSTTLFKVNKLDGKVTPIYDGFPAKDTDGCSCPYTLNFQKKITPSKILPCSEIEVTYHIQNQIGTSWLGLNFVDQFPVGFTIKKIESMTSTLRTIESGEGTNRLELSNMDILLDKNTIRITVAVGDVKPGKWSSQASLVGLPLADGSIILSDDENTPAPNDPNIVEVLGAEDLRLALKPRFSCNGDTVFIQSPVVADTYRWSDGSTGATLTTTRNGVYTLQAFTSCAHYRDSVTIGQRPLKFQVGLGAPRDVDPAMPFDLAFQSNGVEPFKINWKASPFITLSCEDCTNPSAVASQSGMVHLTLIDAYGCWVEDSLAIRVAPTREVYIPNAFSPNGDGHNDVFFIQGRAGSKVVVLRVFDRWGGVLFERQDVPINLPEYGWDPSLSKHLADGVYLFQTVVEFPDGVRKSYQGSFQLLR